MKADALSAGDKIGKYEIRSLLGEGGMGAVYLAYDPLIEREVALKVLSQDVGNSHAALQRFLGEARAIGRLNSPHVVSIYDIDQWNNQYYIVMELLTGGSVADLSDMQGAMPWEEAFQIVAQAARGLAAAHAAGMIHRDIKPENLMLTADGLVKVVDFGLSKLLDDANDHTNRRDQGRTNPRHAAIHESRAVRGRRSGCADRYLQPRGDAVPIADRPLPLSQLPHDPAGDDGPRFPAAADSDGTCGNLAGGMQSDHFPGDGKKSGGSLSAPQRNWQRLGSRRWIGRIP